MRDIIVSSGQVSSGVIVSNGDSMMVLNSGTANNTTVRDLGCMYVSSGGTANSTFVTDWGVLYVSSGGTATNTTVNRYSNLYVSSGGTATNLVAYSGVKLEIAVAPDTYIQGIYAGSSFVMQNAYLSGYTINNLVTLSVFSGGTATKNTVGAGGRMDISSGGTANSTTVDSLGSMYVSSGGTAVSTTVNWFGEMYVSSGGTANNTTVGSGGRMYISSGGTATNIVTRSGASLVITVAPDTYIQGIYAGSSFVMQNAYLSGYTNSHGSMYVSAGGTANSTIVTDCGFLCVFSGGTANNTTVNKYCSMFVSSGGTANNTIVNCGGDYDGGMYISSGGTATNTTVNSGGDLFVFYGGVHSGTLQIADGALVSAYAGAKIDFTVAEQTDSSTALINDWSLINGGSNADYFITVKADQATGTYVLAGRAADFENTVTVKTTDNTTLGTLAVGESKVFDGTNYSFNLNGENLTLAIEKSVTISAKSDVDGNGISDVMFQFTGGDYQIGFWMNGSSTWEGTGASQPANWELLGNYDMNNNGKADQVMFGNVLGGAYIGFYKDGDTTSDGWQNIGFLSNPDGIAWKNAVGNLTGNSGCNSIVWYASELGALGAWTDGTSNWVSLGSGYNENWVMQGCGDFDGNGKDEVLFTYEGNLYSTDIDGNFAALGGWGEDWSVKAIGNFGGDKKDDVVLQNGNMVVKFNNGKADDWESLGTLDSSEWFICGAGDYNNDQKDDLLVRQYSTGMLGYYESANMSQWTELGRGIDSNWTVVA